MNGKFARRSTGVRVLTLVLAFVLVMGASVAGTLAWLSATTGPVVNTFASEELFADAENNFKLWENKAEDTDGDGCFTLTEEKVTTNSYSILPGVNIPKNPTVEIVGLEEYAYLYIKVTGLPMATGLTATVDADNWTELGAAYPGVYVYIGEKADSATKVIKATDSNKVTFNATILTDNQVVVDAAYTGAADDISLSFDAYMVQATGNGANAAEAWANTYGAPAGEGN